MIRGRWICVKHMEAGRYSDLDMGALRAENTAGIAINHSPWRDRSNLLKQKKPEYRLCWNLLYRIIEAAKLLPFLLFGLFMNYDYLCCT